MEVNRRSFLGGGMIAAAAGLVPGAASAAEAKGRRRQFVAACPPSSREYEGRRPGPTRVMIIGAHPDDADITCGGTASSSSSAASR